jgi:hypothetical protein
MSDDTANEGAADAEAAEAATETDEGFEEGAEEGAELGVGVDVDALLGEARARATQARAAWSLIHKELLALLLANCFFFAGALASWSRGVPSDVDFVQSFYLQGIDTIRGAAIFALAIFGFWIMLINFVFRQLIVWPYLINALLALWVGIPGFTRTIGSDKWDRAKAYGDTLSNQSMLDDIMHPLSTIPGGFWLLTAGGALVLIVLLKGILGGASKGRGAGDEGGRRGRR